MRPQNSVGLTKSARHRVIAVLLAVCLPAQAGLGQVRYQFGDEPKWADAGFDDSAWPVVNKAFPLPQAGSDGMVWLRFQVPVPPDRSPLAIYLDRSGGACSPGELWVNGVRVGSQGRFHPKPLTTDHCGTGVFDLREGSVTPGDTAVIAWRSWIAPLVRSALFYYPPKLPAPEIGSRSFMRAREKNAFDSGMLSFRMDGFLDVLELAIGMVVLFIWWRARAGASLLWFSVFVLGWAGLQFAWFWPPDAHNAQSSELYWFWQCGFSLVINTALFEFMGRVFDVPRWATRTLEAAGIAWPILWFPSAFLVEPWPFVTLPGSFGNALFAVQSVGQTALALWAAVRGRKETRGLAVALFFAGAVYLLADYSLVLPGSVRIAGMNVSTDNAATVLVIGAMCYLLLGSGFALPIVWREAPELGLVVFTWIYGAARSRQLRYDSARNLNLAIIGFLCLARMDSGGLGLLSAFFDIGGLRWSKQSLTTTLFATILAILSLRRLTADRREKQRLSSELEAARLVQQLLLKNSGSGAIDAVYQPAQEVGAISIRCSRSPMAANCWRSATSAGKASKPPWSSRC